jgi:hypothetical protein
MHTYIHTYMYIYTHTIHVKRPPAHLFTHTTGAAEAERAAAAMSLASPSSLASPCGAQEGFVTPSSTIGGGGGGEGTSLSPSDIGHSSKAMREEQLGKVRDNLLVSYIYIYIYIR